MAHPVGERAEDRAREVLDERTRQVALRREQALRGDVRDVLAAEAIRLGALHEAVLSSARQRGVQRGDHHVADEADALAWRAFAQEVRLGVDR
ncbi:hypothetical protein [Polyangium spumosum]|uniref:hypothetical protein n=1 Tax=Polyangium spumosum TaxID=889282 RepID=UPI001F0DDD39|nr:hypothetical protein [Polyangium spumosum]